MMREKEREVNVKDTIRKKKKKKTKQNEYVAE